MSSEGCYEKIAIDSLVFFSFGFTLDEDYQFILDRIVEKAYRDATNQGAFNTKADSENAQLAKYGPNGSKDTIVIRIDILLKPKMVDFSSWHTETCKAIEECYKNNGLGGIFTYGNAQKWVNMTLKYIYILGGLSRWHSGSFMDKAKLILRYSKEFHIPIDSYIIDVLWQESGVDLPIKEGFKRDYTKKYAIPSDYVKGWSNWDYTDYERLVESLKRDKEKYNLDWESYAWIARAKERRR